MSFGLGQIGRMGKLGAAGKTGGVLSSELTLDFLALAPDDTTREMLGVHTGTGDLTYTHTSENYVKDSDGVYRGIPANEPMYDGGRVVQNILVDGSEDFTDVLWTNNDVGVTSGISDPDGGTNAYTLKANSGSDSIYQLINVSTNTAMIPSCWVRRRTGTGAIQFYNGKGTGDDNISALIDSTWRRVWVHPKWSPEGETNGRFGFRVDTINDEIDVYLPQAESMIVDSVSASNVITNGTFDADTDWNKGTGWTISGGVASCDGSQTGSSDLGATVNPLSNRTYYLAKFTISNYSAGNIVVRAGGNSYTNRSANGTYYEVVSTNTNSAFAMRADINFVGDIDDVELYELTAVTLVPGENVTAGSTKVFANANGNSISYDGSSGVSLVTEAVGADLASMPYLLRHQDATNSLTYSNDQSNASWSKVSTCTATQDAVGLTGEANTACTITDDGAGAIEYVGDSNIITDDSNTHIFKVWYKKTTSETRRVSIVLNLTGGTSVLGAYTFNTNDGTLTAKSTNAGTVSAEANQDGDWWIVCASATNNSTGNTTATTNIGPAVATSDAGTWDVAATGSTIIGNAELHLNTTIDAVKALPPIFTTSASVSIDGGSIAIPAANHHLTSGAYYVEHYSDYAGSNGNNAHFHAIYTDGSDDGYIAVGGGLSRLVAYYINTSDVNASSLGTSSAISEGSLNKVATICDAGEAKLNINVGGSWETEKTNFKTLRDNSEDIQIDGRIDANTPFKVRNLRRYSGTYAQYETVIDTLMGA